MIARTFLIILLGTTFFIGGHNPAIAGDDLTRPVAWHHGPSLHRFKIQITTARLASPIDVARMVIDTMGIAKPDGRDLMMFDKNGSRVALNIDQKNSFEKRLFTIEFQVKGKGEEIFYLYFNNPGVPARPFKPRYGGLTLSVGSHPSGMSARSFRNIKKSIPKFKAVRTGRRPNIDDLENPFPWKQRGEGSINWENSRDSDNLNYLGIYRGTLYFPETGKFTLATNSDDWSFVELDGKEFVSKPQTSKKNHRYKDGLRDRPMINEWKTRRTRPITKGVHNLVYYHIQYSETLLARLGWRFPGKYDLEDFHVVPAKYFIRTLQAKVLNLQAKDGKQLPYFENEIQPTYLFGTNHMLFRERLVCRGDNIPKKISWTLTGKPTLHENSPLVSFMRRDPKSDFQIQEITMTADGATLKRLILIRQCDPFDLQRRYLELQPIAGRHIAFRGETVDLTAVLRNATAPIDIQLTVGLKIAGQPTTQLLCKNLLMKTGQLKKFQVNIPGDKLSNVPSADINFEIRHDGILIEKKQILVRTAKSLPKTVVVKDNIPQTANNQLIFMELGLHTKPLDINSMRRVVMIGDLLGTKQGGLDDLKKGITKLVNRQVKIDTVQGASASVMEAIPAVLKTTIGKGDLAVVSFGLADMQVGTSSDDFERGLSFIVDSLMERGAMVVIITSPPRCNTGGLDNAYAISTKRAALKRNLPVVDFYSHMVMQPTTKDYFRDPTTDHYYPLPQGRKKLMSYLLYKLEKQIR